MINIVSLDPDKDLMRVADLFDRAGDYIRLETGRDPDIDYAREAMVEAPPQVPPEDIHLFGLERTDHELAGFVGCLTGHYEPNEWYIGLLLLDPAVRGMGLGRLALRHIIQLARNAKGTVLRIAVLEANPAGRRFWEREGFVHERTVPADPDGDGHIRHVMRCNLEKDLLAYG
ncbi:GNAT family N-acetyltransferase [Pontivivens insulae]|nr:GNAT family N-acetyltransferase [Pontivivens insulae]